MDYVLANIVDLPFMYGVKVLGIGARVQRNWGKFIDRTYKFKYHSTVSLLRTSGEQEYNI